MRKPLFAVVMYEHESVYTVTAIKVSTGTFDQCRDKVDDKRDSDNDYAVVLAADLEDRDEVNARNIRQVYPEPVGIC